MDHRERQNRQGSHQEPPEVQGSVPIRPRAVAAAGPVSVEEPLKVLARMPNLEAEPAPRHSHRRTRSSRRDEARILSSRIAVPLLLAAGLLLLAVAVVPSFLGDKETADATDEGAPPVWKSPDSDPWANSSPIWDSKSAREQGEAARQATSAATEPAVGGFAASLPDSETPDAVSAQPVQAQASTFTNSSRAVTGNDGGQIASWRDPGQWPYGNGVGGAPAQAAALDNAEPAEQTASYELPDGVQGSRIPYVTAEPVPADATEQAAVGMNRPMQLDPQDVGQVGDYRTATQRSAQPADADRWANASAAVYSADRRNSAGVAPTGVYPSAYPEAAPASIGSPSNQPYAAGSPIGSVIPGSTDAGYGSGANWATGQEPTARLQGVIEKPSPRTTYDYNRSSIH